MSFGCSKKVFGFSLERVSPSSKHGRLLIRTQSFKCIWLLVRTRLAPHSNVLGHSFQPVWHFVWTHFGLSFERVSYNTGTRPDCGAKAFIRGANALGQKTHSLVRDRYGIWCSSRDNLDNFEFSSIVNTTFLRLIFSVILRTLLKFIQSTTWLLRICNETKAVFR